MFRFAASALLRPRRRLLVVGALAVSLVALNLVAPLAVARPNAPTRNDKYISLMVAALMDKFHLSEMEVNDEISRRAFDQFFKSIDPLKLYFMRSDVDRFVNQRLKLDDYVQAGKIEVAKEIFDVFLTRVNERIALAHEFVDAEHDFTADEFIIRDPEELNFATSEAEARERWRKRVKFDMLVQVSDDDSTEKEAREKLHKRYRSIQRRWEQTNNDELLEIFLGAITKSFDPHTEYLSPSTYENMQIHLRLELDGIGASLESKYGETIVRRIVPGGAADKDGRLQVDDVITGVGEGRNGEIVDIFDMKLNDVVMKIRGKPGTVVRLETKAADGSGIHVYDITRDRIELKDEEARSVILERDWSADEDGDFASNADAANQEAATGQVVESSGPGGDAARIGVIQLPGFYMDMDGRQRGRRDYKSTTRDVRKLLEDFNKQDVDLVVVDLRYNGGGLLSEAVQMTGLFIDRGPVVQVKGPDGKKQPLRDSDPGVVWDGPLVVLVNRFSASASEIFAGAIQDYGRGIVVGDRATFGKGTVQQIHELGELLRPINPPNFGALKLTIQQFYRPGGDSTQNRGVLSDIELPSQRSHWEVGESDLEYALAFDRVAPLISEVKKYPLSGAQLIDEVRKRSRQRVDESEYFQSERKRIDRYLERQEDPTMTLNKEKFLAERKELNTEKEQEKQVEEMQMGERPVFADSPYNQEVVAIALDYLELLGSRKLAAAR